MGADKSKQVQRRSRDKNDQPSDQTDVQQQQNQRKSSSSKKENRKSTPAGVAMTGSHGYPSRQQQQVQQQTTAEKSGSGGKRRDHPSGVGAVGGRGSILHNTVNPLLTELHQRYTHHRSS